MFFKKFPKIDYALISDPKTEKKVTNILTSFFLRKMTYRKSLFFQQYFLKDEDIPESLSYDVYHNVLHYWTILVINKIVDPYSEWVLPTNVLEKFVEKKYKNGIKLKLKDGSTFTKSHSAGSGGIHHFFNIQTGRLCDDVDDEIYREIWSENPRAIGENIIPVTNLIFEKDENFKKRKITLISPNQMNRFEEDFSKMLEGTR